MSGDCYGRRQFVKALGTALLGSCLPWAPASATVPLQRPRLSLPLSRLRDHYDVVVIGSGYGGAVMAARLAPGRRLCVLERGREWQPADFPGNAASVLGQVRRAKKPLGLFDVHIGANLSVLSGSGLGGTSLINANVVIAPDREVFADWPAAIRDDYLSGAMDAYEARVRLMLAADAVGEADGLRKTWFHRSTTQARARQGAEVEARLLQLAVNLHGDRSQPNAQGVLQAPCSFCGDCVTGCRVGAKSTLDVNYLPLARRGGAEIFAGVEVEWIERLDDGRWRLHYVAHRDAEDDLRGEIVTANVVVAAGALGSTQLLLHSQQQGLSLSPALGSRFSSNGDLLGFAYNTAVQTNINGFGISTPPVDAARIGPTITIAADYRAAAVADRYRIEEGAVPSAFVDIARLAFPVVGGKAADFPARQRVERDLAHRRSDGALNHGMVYLGIGHDSAGGRVELNRRGEAAVVWPGIAQESFVQRGRAEMAAHARVFGGNFIGDSVATSGLGAELITVHPLGGCPMADRIEDGVVDADGRVYDPRGNAGAVYAGLRVLDGAILRGSLGANPLLTIAALAERAAERYAPTGA